MKQKIKELVKKMRLMDDDFMSLALNDIGIMQFVLNIVLENKELKVHKIVPQREFKTVEGRAVRFDIFAEDENGEFYDIEIQRSDRGATPQRARYNSAVLDTYSLRKGEDFSKLKETYIIFITENDVLGCDLPLYHIDRTVKETGLLFNDGTHIIFVNGEYTDTSDDIGKLMHDFRCTDAEDMHFPQLAERVNYFKKEGGNSTMCKLVEDFLKENAIEVARETARETAKENAINLLKNGVSPEVISDSLGIPLDEIKALKEKI